jgi:hypothetical protein
MKTGKTREKLRPVSRHCTGVVLKATKKLSHGCEGNILASAVFPIDTNRIILKFASPCFIIQFK